MFFEFEGEGFIACFDDLAICKDVHKIRDDVVQKPLVVGNDDGCVLRRFEFVDALCHNAECVDIES